MSLLYCFLNSEVRLALRHRFELWRDERNIRLGQLNRQRYNSLSRCATNSPVLQSHLWDSRTLPVTLPMGAGAGACSLTVINIQLRPLSSSITVGGYGIGVGVVSFVIRGHAPFYFKTPDSPANPRIVLPGPEPRVFGEF